MKSLFGILILFGSAPLLSEPFHMDVHAHSAILMSADTGAVLFEKNAHELRHPASITKIATAIYALKKNRNFLDSEVIAEQDSIGTVREEEKIRTNFQGPPYRLIVGGTHIMIKNGEILPLRALLYGLMLESGNDAANVIAQYTSGKINAFVKEMNQYLFELGCQNTHFLNPSGIYHPDHQTTAYDMAVMARHGLKDPIFREIVKTLRYTRPKTNKQDEMPMIQHNQLLKRGSYYYEHAIGIKTGYHSFAGHTLVAAAEHDGRTLIAVSMGCKNKNESYGDAIALFNKAFSESRQKQTLLSKGPQKFSILIDNGKKSVHTFTKEAIVIEFYRSEIPKVQAWISPIEISLPIREGDKIGEMVFADKDGIIFKTADLYAAENLNDSFFRQLAHFWSQNAPEMRYLALCIIICGCFLGVVYVIFRG